MLKITVPASEIFNSDTGEFISTKEQVLSLEHSLVSLSKWEAKHNKPYLTRDPKTTEEIIDYVRCMTLTQNVDPNVYLVMTQALLDQISVYIDASMTATTFSKENRRGGDRRIVTAELIYYWMISHNIPFECQKWHLNRLITLINVCNAESQPPKKVPRSEQFAHNRALNASRKRRLNTRG